MRRDLVELLRKCHRDELLPLAELVGIKPAGMKLGTLARAIDRRVRRAAANELANLFLRGGDGPSYAEALRHLGHSLGLEVPVDLELAEQAIVREHAKREWRRLPADERAERWEAVMGQPPAPDGDADVVALLERRHERGVGYHLTRLVSDPPVPGAGCFVLVYLARPRWDLLLPSVLAIHRLRQALRHRVTVGIVGSPSSGKDAGIAAIFGIETGNVNPVAGSTKSVEITRLPQATALFVVNTPGMGDVVQEVTEEAKEVLDHIDVYIYVVNAQGGVQARERADYDACVARRRPVLAVINKIDTLREGDRDRYLSDARAKLGARPEDFLAVAFDPLPQLSEHPIGIDAVRTWLEGHLAALGKDITELPWVEAPTQAAGM